jgi:hypothetical protein
MQQDDSLLTIVQISDLHIGEIDPSNGDASISSTAASLFAQSTWFDGILGHHGRALQDLAEFWAKLIKKDKQALVLVSGDITRCGGVKEFDVANEFLKSAVDLNPPQKNHCGLGVADWRDFAIPGNHDHWEGAVHPWGRPTRGLLKYFPSGAMPYIREVTLGNGRTVLIAGIDTDADVGPFSLKRMAAIGSFKSQLRALDPLFRQKNREGAIAALVMHHSWAKKTGPLSIDSGSRDALARFLRNHSIKLILTGHTHESVLLDFLPDTESGPSVLECRCGTTTQHDEVPYDWLTAFKKFPRRQWPQNCLLVHRLIGREGSTMWDVETFARTRDKGFRSIGFVGQRNLVV